jgi:PTS system nitrogen regulatory IIA component
MNLSDYTIDHGFLPRLDCGDVDGTVAKLVERLAREGEVASVTELVGEVMRREKEGSTAIGGGLVLPHARFAGVRRVRLAVATLANPLQIPSEDGLPVDIVILLVGPQNDPRQMLRVLARLARLVRQKEYLQGLREADSPELLQAAFARAGENNY